MRASTPTSFFRVFVWAGANQTRSGSLRGVYALWLRPPSQDTTPFRILRQNEGRNPMPNRLSSPTFSVRSIESSREYFVKIHHLRNATALITLGEHRLLVDPMLAESGSFPGFKMFGGGRRPNPLVPLPPEADAALESASAVVVTHEHPDHLDRPAIEWIKARRLPVWASPVDAPNLTKKGLDVQPLRDGALGMGVEIVQARHGRGVLGWLMGPVSSYYLAHADEPSLLVTGDAVLSDDVLDAMARLRPDVVVAPAGSANMGVGGSILFSVDELVTLVKRAPGQVVLNHLEALDHCLTTREGLRARMASEGLSAQVHIPDDGEVMEFDRSDSAPHAPPGASTTLRPGFQKWLTSWFTMT